MNNNFHILILLLFICSNALAPSIGASGQSPSHGLLMDGGAFSTDLAPAYLRRDGDRHRVHELVAGRAGHVVVLRSVDRLVLRTFWVRRLMRSAMNRRIEADVWRNVWAEDKS